MNGSRLLLSHGDPAEEDVEDGVERLDNLSIRGWIDDGIDVVELRDNLHT